MFDAKFRVVIDPLLERVGKLCLRAGLGANALTLTGFGIGVCCGVLIYNEAYLWALSALVANRVLDGLDGVVARLTQPTDFGGYLDIVCDFLFYALVPFSFAVSQPDLAPAAAFLMLSFVGTGTSFLAFAILDAKHRPDLNRKRTKNKSFANLGGLTEGAETIAIFVLFLVFPSLFVPLAVGFGLLCWLTTGCRIYATWAEFAKEG